MATDADGKDIVRASKPIEAGTVSVVLDGAHGNFTGSRTRKESLDAGATHWVRVREVRQPDWSPWHMAERVGAWFRSRAEEVLEEPHTYGADLEDLRLQICGAVAEDLEQDYGEGVEDMIRRAYTDAGLPTGVAGP